jgi:NAD(P) transhydrogenase
VIGYPALAATSSEQGRLAACHMFDLLAQPMGKHFPIGIYSIPEISMVGQTEEELTNQKVPYETGIARFNEIARGQISGDDSGMFKMIFGREDGSLASIASVRAPRSYVGQSLLAWVGFDISLTRSSIHTGRVLQGAAYNAANKINYVRPHQGAQEKASVCRAA